MKYLVCLLTIFSLASCSRQCTTDMICGQDLDNITFYGYSYADLDTIVFRWHKPGSNFSDQTNEQFFYLDSTAKAVNNSNYYAVSLDKSLPTDSLRLLRLFYLHQVPDGNTADDFELFIPANNRTYRVSDILLDGDYKTVQSHPCSKAPPGGFCYRRIVSHKINGLSVNTESPVIQK